MAGGLDVRYRIVDDEPGIRGALSQLLEFEGYEVKAVPTAVDGLKEYERWRPHLVFLDESGFFLTPTVRRTLAPRGKTPVLKAWDRRDRWSAISCVTLSPA